MTSPVVIDASAALALILSERGSKLVRGRLTSWQRSAVDVYVPAHFWLEVANSLIRRHGHSTSVAFEAVHRLEGFGLLTADIDRPLVLLALDRAGQHGLSMYDAAYLALAHTLDGRLFSADRRLLAAAGPRAIPLPAADRRLSEPAVPYGDAHDASWPLYRGASAFLAKLRAEARKPVEGTPRR